MRGPGRYVSCAACSESHPAASTVGGHGLRAPARPPTASSWTTSGASMPHTIGARVPHACMPPCGLRVGPSAGAGLERLMRRHDIRALAGRRFQPCTTDSRHELPIAPNLLKQDFSAAQPSTVWLAEPKVRAATSPTCRLARAGCTWPPSSIWPRARSSAGRCAITCAPS